MIPKSEFAFRRQKLVAEIVHGVSRTSNSASKHLVVLPSSEVQYMAYHIPYPFLQDSNFMYLTGLKDVTGALIFQLTIEPSVKNDPSYTCEEYLFCEFRTPREEIWDGPSMSESIISDLTGIRSISPLQEFPIFLKHNAKNVMLWYAPLVDGDGDKKPINKFVLSEILEINETVRKKTRNPQPFIDALRFVKSENEIRCLQLATATTAECLKETMKASYCGMSEDFLRTKLEFESRLHGCTLGYPPVVAGADRANVIHYLWNSQTIEDGDLVLVDVGCRMEGYTADLTRTWPVNGHFSPVQLVLYEILMETLKTCSSMATPERSLSDLHNIMLRELRRHLEDERIIPQTNSFSLIQDVCPHHVGHYLGLDIHDTPTVSYSRRLEPGVVFPLEPGIYFRSELEKFGILKECIGIGMRLEDDFVINKAGKAESLTNELPREPSLLESLVLSKVPPLSSRQMP
ncbi:unnamed protein product [Echinostoma caproni]|uniref:Ig-like domain-containing protein n=1 Tax=Echinostoma caproni TaxID=27848 RepID=A0A183B7E1_9TREM|nr:unnamed protein product [Echinostoma caproni]